MAWNEPGNKGNGAGGNGEKDPWGGNRGGNNGKNNQGPPDLEEMLKNLQNKILGLFGGGTGPGNGGAASSGGFGVMLIIFMVIVAGFYAYSGLYVVQEGVRGVVLRFGEFNDITKPGLHWAPKFIDEVILVDISNEENLEIGYETQGDTIYSKKEESLMLTKDENIVSVKLAVQYVVGDPKDFALNVRDPRETLKQVTESVLREVVGKKKMDYVLTEGRDEVAALVKKDVQAILEENYRAGIVINVLNLQDVQPPDEVQEAFEDVIKAREDREKSINEANGYRNKVVPKAEGQAARITKEAEGYKAKVVSEAKGEADRFESLLAEYKKAPEVTRERMYLDAIEQVMSASSKILLDGDQSKNIMYLPLDELMHSSGASYTGKPDKVRKLLGSASSESVQDSNNMKSPSSSEYQDDRRYSRGSRRRGER